MRECGKIIARGKEIWRRPDRKLASRRACWSLAGPSGLRGYRRPAGRSHRGWSWRDQRGRAAQLPYTSKLLHLIYPRFASPATSARGEGFTWLSVLCSGEILIVPWDWINSKDARILILLHQQQPWIIWRVLVLTWRKRTAGGNYLASGELRICALSCGGILFRTGRFVGEWKTSALRIFRKSLISG